MIKPLGQTPRWWIAAAALAAPCFAQAESLRCSGGTVSEGESRVSVAYKCGSPLLQDSYCKPIEYLPAAPVQRSRAGLVVAPLPTCEQVDEWLYDRGPGNLMAKVRFRSAKVESIDYGRFPR